MRTIVLGAVVAVLILSSGCDISVMGTPGSGVAATQDRTVGDFHAISATGMGKVNVVVGEENSVVVTLDDNLIDMVQTEVVDGELKISTSGNYSSKLGLDVQVTAPTLDGVTVSGVVNLTATNVKGQAVKVNVSGVGGATISGEVDELDVTVSGSSQVKLKDLVAKKVKVAASGTAGAEVFATESVDANSSGTANINVHGNPADVKQESSGVSDIVVGE
jgi:hypothetical protein